MKQFSKSAMLVFLLFFFTALNVSAETFEEHLRQIVNEYFKITTSLANDSTAGVVDAAKKIESLAGGLSVSALPAEQAALYRQLPERLKKSAQKLSQAAGIEAMRNALVNLSEVLAEWVKNAKPKGIYLVYCSMKPAFWLQQEKTVRNPYFGSAMLRCGEIVLQPEKEKAQDAPAGAPSGGHHH